VLFSWAAAAAEDGSLSLVAAVSLAEKGWLQRQFE
jgi:hypothetical protein